MSFNKIIIGFIIILIIFSGIIVYAINKTGQSTVKIDNHTFSVEVATTSAQQEQGLSGRASLPQNQGMLFLFQNANRYAFWMKEMHFPLDIIFINNNKIVSIAQDVPPPTNPNQNPNDLPIYQPTAPADAALEINGGLAKKYGFMENDLVIITLKK